MRQTAWLERRNARLEALREREEARAASRDSAFPHAPAITPRPEYLDAPLAVAAAATCGAHDSPTRELGMVDVESASDSVETSGSDTVEYSYDSRSDGYVSDGSHWERGGPGETTIEIEYAYEYEYDEVR